MEVTKDIVPCNNLYEDINTFEQILMSDDNPDQIQQTISGDQAIEKFHDFEEILNHPNDLISDTDEAGPSRIFQGETSGKDKEWQYSNFGQNWNSRKSAQLSVWPVPAIPFTCSCCQVLREIIHTNGTWTQKSICIEITKFEIHGRLGIICHAILDRFSGEVDATHEYQMFDFCGESTRNVKQFLTEYCEERKQSNFVIIQDPLSEFYEAVCVGLDWMNLNHNNNQETNDFDPVDEFQTDQPIETMADDVVRRTGFSLAQQRQKTSKLKLKDLLPYLHLPMSEVAKEMDLCLSTVKKICRKYGLLRWPYRQVKSIRREIEKARSSLNGGGGGDGEKMRAQIQLQTLEIKLANIVATFSDQ